MSVSRMEQLSRRIIQTFSKQRPVQKKRGVLDGYIRIAPSPQTALDIFQGEWTSHLPEPLAAYQAGALGLFYDERIKWLANEIGGLSGKSVLELGPLEGGHTYMLEQLGATDITAVEASARAFLKCLIIKELFNLRRAHFLCGDCVEYLRYSELNFDVCIASGVLYHMQNPAELIALLAKHCTQHLYIWTHYYDQKIISASEALAPRFNCSRPAEVAGFQHTLYQQEYQKTLDWNGFCGGSAPISNWLSRDDLVRCLQHFGFSNLRFNFDDPSHPNGPALAIIAARH